MFAVDFDDISSLYQLLSEKVRVQHRCERDRGRILSGDAPFLGDIVRNLPWDVARRRRQPVEVAVFGREPAP